MKLIASSTALAAGLAIAMPAFSAEAPKPVTLTDDELAVLRVIVECRKDATPDRCAPFRGLVADMAEGTPEEGSIPGIGPAPSATPAPVQTSAATPTTSEPLTFTQGHGPGLDGQPLPDPLKPKVTFAAASDTKSASLSLSFDLGQAVNGDPRTLAIVAQTPIGQDDEYTNLATLDGMTKASSIGLEYTRLKVKMLDRSAVIATSTYQTACTAILGDLARKDPKLKIPPALLAPGGCHAGMVQSVIDTSAVLTDASRDDLTARATKLLKEANPIVDHVWMFTGGAKVGYEKHKFYDPLTLDKAEVDRTPFEASAAATYVFHRGDMSWTLRYAFQRSYQDGGEDGAAKVLCPTAGSPFLTCVNGFIDRPLRQKQHLVSLDYRYIAAHGPFGVPMGFNPGVTYDAQSGEYGFQVPVYLFADKTKYLTGGVRYDWNSEDKESIFGIFVSTSFCVLPGFSGCTSSEK